MDLVLILAGAGLLYLGGEGLVKSSANLATALGLSPFVIGLTVVAFGTSSPEAAATITAAIQGSPEVTFGTVVGSNISNLGLILGLTALIWPLDTKVWFVRREVPFMLGASFLLFILVGDEMLSRLEGFLLLVLLAIGLAVIVQKPGEPKAEETFELRYSSRRASVILNLLLLAASLGLLALGAKLLVSGAVSLARAYGITERVIGLTLVAFGTSLPELASCLVAAARRQGDIVLGNIIGSNIFNILGALGLTLAIKPIGVDRGDVLVDLVVMFALSVLTLPFLLTRLRLERWEAATLLSAYVAYIVYLFS